jgi:hypothetical protein
MTQQCVGAVARFAKKCGVGENVEKQYIEKITQKYEFKKKMLKC